MTDYLSALLQVRCFFDWCWPRSDVYVFRHHALAHMCTMIFRNLLLWPLFSASASTTALLLETKTV